MNQNGINKDNHLNFIIQKQLGFVNTKQQKLECAERLIKESDNRLNTKYIFEMFDVDMEYYKIVQRKRKLEKIYEKITNRTQN